MRHFLLLFVILLLFSSSTHAQQGCRSVEYKQDLLSRNPGLVAQFMEVENFTRRQLQHSSTIVTGTTGSSQNEKGLNIITIPVVVHIVYSSSSQNISDAQIQTQIAVLNRDYGKSNADTSKIPSYYSGLAADCAFRFALANVDTNGNTTTGIIRKQTNQHSFSYDDAIKFTARGGDNGWDRDRYLNLWVGSLSSGILGYSSAPGCEKPNDGVVISFTAFGTTGTAAAPFNLGRTATHEIGHWFNLIHIWGDAACGDDDVDDTPQQGSSTHGSPSGMVFSCGNTAYGNLYMDFMDFTDDIGMHLFTYGQRDRMRSLFAKGGARYAILSSNGIAPGTDIPTTNGAGSGAAAIRLYPNPVVGTVSIIFPDASHVGGVLEIYNQVGQKVRTNLITGASFQLDLSSLPKGLYFLRVDGDNRNSYKLVKI